jgi:LysM repeat protein
MYIGYRSSAQIVRQCGPAAKYPIVKISSGLVRPIVTPRASRPIISFPEWMHLSIFASSKHPPGGRFDMMRADGDAATSVGLPSAVRRSPASFLLYLCIVGISASITIGAALCSAQDVADAARQERARKEAQQKKPKHVYTEEDLKRAQILIPEDRDQVEAKKIQPAPLPAEKSLDAVDAESLSAGAPLGQVARQVRRQKDSLELRRAQQLALPLTEAPMLASPKPPLRSISPVLQRRSPVPPLDKATPSRLVPFHPPAKRSPFSPPRILMSTPPRTLSSGPVLPALSAPRPAAPLAARAPRSSIVPAQPRARTAPNTLTKLSIVTVKRGDSLWKLAQQNLGTGFRWHDVLAVNPHLRDANHIEVGSQIFLPTAVSSHPPTTLTIQSGNSLSKIARARFGDASLWSCIARANPSIADPNLIHDGQTLTLPASCRP